MLRRVGAAPVLSAAFVLSALLATVGVSVVAAQAGWMLARNGLTAKDLNAVYFADSKRGWVAGDDGVVLHTEDSGRTWTRQRVDTTDPINDIYFRNKEDGYLLAGNRIFMTEDGGRTWRLSTRFQPQTFGGASPELYSVRFPSKKRGWVVGSLSRRERIEDSLVLYTEDGGESWQRRKVPVEDELIHLDFDGEKRGWIVGSRGRVLHTSDRGETWTLQETGTTETLFHVEFRGDDDGWAVGERGTILRTTDGGKSWQKMRSPVSATLLTVKFVSGDDGWIAGRGGVILRTEDEGRTWVRQETGTQENIYALYMEKKFGWAVGGDGLMLRYER